MTAIGPKLTGEKYMSTSAIEGQSGHAVDVSACRLLTLTGSGERVAAITDRPLFDVPLSSPSRVMAKNETILGENGVINFGFGRLFHDCC